MEWHLYNIERKKKSSRIQNSGKTFSTVMGNLKISKSPKTHRLYHQQTQIKINIKENSAGRRNMIQEGNRQMEEDNKNNKIRKYVGKHILILITQNSMIISCVHLNA